MKREVRIQVIAMKLPASGGKTLLKKSFCS
jgi:hypothetical protein